MMGFGNTKASCEFLGKHATCANCANYNPAPADAVRVPLGWCAALHEFTEAHFSASDCDELEMLVSYMMEVAE